MDTKISMQKQAKLLQEKEAQIKKIFLNKGYPKRLISYKDFLQHFIIHQQNFKQQNLNIIDMHLRYRWYVRERMAPYKWTIILSLTPIFYRSFSLCLFIPIFTVNMFDHYFERFFVWRYRKDKIINIRNQFITKLSKDKNKLRRILLFQELKKSFAEEEALKLKNIEQNVIKAQGEIKETPQKDVQASSITNKQKTKVSQPLKYLKFGQFTQYLFHSNIQGKQQSSILQTTLFDNYLSLMNLIKERRPIQFCKQVLSQFKQNFIAFKNDADRKKYTIDVNSLIQSDLIKLQEIYTLQQNIDHNVRRFSELWQYLRHDNLEPSNFNLWEYTNLSKYQDIFDPVKYNIKSNSPDLLLYYSIIFIPKVLSFIFKRR